MKRLFSIFLIIACIFPIVSALAVGDIENVHVGNRTRYVSDMAGAMSPAGRAQADSLLASMWRQSSAEPVVVIVSNLDGEEINDFATRLFTHWA